MLSPDSLSLATSRGPAAQLRYTTPGGRYTTPGGGTPHLGEVNHTWGRYITPGGGTSHLGAPFTHVLFPFLLRIGVLVLDWFWCVNPPPPAL